MSDERATPRPWRAVDIGSGQAVIHGAGGQRIGGILAEADARLIVAAVNAWGSRPGWKAGPLEVIADGSVGMRRGE
jgi:hypothetical protein